MLIEYAETPTIDGSIIDDVPEEMAFDYATAVAEHAIELMSQHAVPPTADNFSVWFQYALGTDPAFNKTIDIIISNKRTFDKRTNWSLLQALRRSQGKESQINQTVTDRLTEVLNKATGYLSHAAAENHAQVERLDGVALQVESHGDLLSIISDLTAELSRAALRANALELQFAATSRELHQLRKSLKVAEHCANTDALTGLANRRALDEFLRQKRIQAMESDEPLSVMLIDIDHFKKFNDRFGHQLGDQVLRLIAEVVKKGLRTDDLAARYGGEELVAVVPGADLVLCRDVADRIRRTIAERQIVHRPTGASIAKVTVSIGVAQFVLGETVNELFDRCDRALYLAKDRGRNRTMTENDLVQ